jgi:nitroimidazol reductase NimA-like FMN-containing flavoprotein (pyridoxamine 5'-phosphate oxidase superfamily)
MAANIPEQYKDLFKKVAFANLATLMPDGSPQVTPVWFDLDGSHIRVNSAKGRVKDKNMRRNKKVALSIIDPIIPIAIWTCKVRWWISPSRALTRILMRWLKSIWEKISIRFASPGKCG